MHDLKSLMVLASLPLVAGCLGSAPPAPTNWLVEWRCPEDFRAAKAEAAAPLVRLSAVEVCSPYGGTHIAVLRPDGSIAFDAYNVFASSPASLLRSAAADSLTASGRFELVVGQQSRAAVGLSVEVTVTRLALDCRAEGKRDALVELSLLLLDGRNVVSTSRAEASAAAADGRYTEAFSKAFAKAMVSAASSLKLK